MKVQLLYLKAHIDIIIKKIIIKIYSITNKKEYEQILTEIDTLFSNDFTINEHAYYTYYYHE